MSGSISNQPNPKSEVQISIGKSCQLPRPLLGRVSREFQAALPDPQLRRMGVPRAPLAPKLFLRTRLLFFRPARQGACSMHCPSPPPRSLPMPLLRHSPALAPHRIPEQPFGHATRVGRAARLGPCDPSAARPGPARGRPAYGLTTVTWSFSVYFPWHANLFPITRTQTRGIGESSRSFSENNVCRPKFAFEHSKKVVRRKGGKHNNLFIKFAG